MPDGAFVISFDFELAWGIRRSSEENGRYAGIERTREVVTELLAIFVRHGIPATWATVGHLMLRPDDCPGGRFDYDLPAPTPPWFQGRWFDNIPPIDSPEAGRFYAPESVRAILDCPVPQELATHTFSHVQIGETSCSAEVARAEFAKSQELASRWGNPMRSVVFPRNDVGHLDALRDSGFTCYRGQNSEWYWFGDPPGVYKRKWLRYPVWMLRYLDERFCFTPPLPLVQRREGLWEIPHGMFFPGLTGVSKFISPELRVRRAVRGLHRAAETGRIFSLYTHPENFLPHPERLLPAFEDICREAARLRDAGDFQILTMGGIVDELEAGRNLQWVA